MAGFSSSRNTERDAISFPEWNTALMAAVPAAQREAYRREILSFLRHCKLRHAPATIALARQYVAGHESARVALRWFVTWGRARGGPASSAALITAAVSTGADRRERAAEANVACGPLEPDPGRVARGMEPPPAALDLGGPEWERALIAALRRKGLLWRTEQIYREWAARFARFIAPRRVRTADEAEVGAFLSNLAVEARASQSTQKQAA